MVIYIPFMCSILCLIGVISMFALFLRVKFIEIVYDDDQNAHKVIFNDDIREYEIMSLIEDIDDNENSENELLFLFYMSLSFPLFVILDILYYVSFQIIIS